MTTPNNHKKQQWFVMRDLKRANAKDPAYKLLQEKQIQFFTPMTWRLYTVHGKKERREVPFMADLLFVHSNREELDPIVELVPTLQYRWLRNTWRQPMTVGDAEMERFIRAVGASVAPKYYLPEEITSAMTGRRIRIVGGPLHEMEGTLVTTRGSKVKRLLVKLPNLLGVAVEVSPEFIQLIES